MTSPASLSDSERYDVVCRKDRRWDGQFVFAVNTTGIYCRPSCGARTPRKQNVEYFDTPEAAARAGYRACKRCTPEGVAPAVPAWVEQVCRRIETSDTNVLLADLAQPLGRSASSLQRAFKVALGVTPKEYATAVRHQRLLRELVESETVTTAGYAAGYGSSGRLYEATNAVLGMTPTRYRGFGAGEVIEYACAPCRLGRLLVGRTARGVCAISLGTDDAELTADLRRRFAEAELISSTHLDAELAAVLTTLDTGELDDALPLDIRGTAFQHRVWQELRAIPPGQTRTYSELAEAIGAPRAVRAVGAACAANRLALVVPCHRAVRRDGGLGGFRWGIEAKRRLLAQEQTPDCPSRDSVESQRVVNPQRSVKRQRSVKPQDNQ